MENYPSDWKKRRAKVFKRDGNECQGCGITNRKAERVQERGLHVHHIKPISEGGTHRIDNLIALCEECHIATHRENEEQPYDPVYWDECAYCGREYSSLEGYDRNWCSRRCVAYNEAEKALNVVTEDIRLCGTCFFEVDRSMDVCPNCGNWDFKQDNSDKLLENNINVLHLLARVMYWVKYGE